MTGLVGYLCPATVDDAVERLASAPGCARVLAGGTDLMVALRHGADMPDQLVDITRIPELTEIRREADGTLRIGAAARHSRVASDPLVRAGAPVLAAAAATVGSVQIRNLGSLGGNVVNAAVAADTLPALAVLRARFEVAGPQGRRRLSLDELFLGPGRTCLAPSELLTAVLIPALPVHGHCFLKVGRRRSAAISRLSVAVLVNPASGLARIALGAVFPRPQRVLRAEEELTRGFDDPILEAAGVAAEAQVREISGERSSMAYKLPVIRELVTRALRQAVHGCSEVNP